MHWFLVHVPVRFLFDPASTVMDVRYERLWWWGCDLTCLVLKRRVMEWESHQDIDVSGPVICVFSLDTHTHTHLSVCLQHTCVLWKLMAKLFLALGENWARCFPFVWFACHWLERMKSGSHKRITNLTFWLHFQPALMQFKCKRRVCC